MEGISYDANNQQNTGNNTPNNNGEAKKTYLEALVKKNSPKIGDSRDIIITQNKPQEITAYNSPSLEESYQNGENTTILEIITPQTSSQTPNKIDKGKKRATNEDTNSP